MSSDLIWTWAIAGALSLAVYLAAVFAMRHMIHRMTRPRHRPIVVPTPNTARPTRYDVYCVGCSAAARQNVWPCREGSNADIPSTLVSAIHVDGFNPDDAEDCGACTVSDDACTFHHGINRASALIAHETGALSHRNLDSRCRVGLGAAVLVARGESDLAREILTAPVPAADQPTRGGRR